MVYELIKLPQYRVCSVVRRLNRFVVLINCGQGIEEAYITNTGRLEGLLKPRVKAYCVPKHSGRIKYWLVATEEVGGPALIDTRLQERAFAVAVNESLIPWLKGFKTVLRNPRIGDSVLDYLLKDVRGRELVIELKSAVLRSGPNGEYSTYPDCPSERGVKHLKQLIKLAEEGKEVAAVFINTLSNVKAFTPNDDVDPRVRKLLRKLRSKGGLIKAITLTYDPRRNTIKLTNTDLPTII